MKAVAKNHETGREYNMVEVGPADFAEITSKYPDLIGLPMFYCRKEGGFFKCWPHPQNGFTADFIGEASMFSIGPAINISDVSLGRVAEQ